MRFTSKSLLLDIFLCITIALPWCNVLPHSTVWPYFFKIKLYLEVPGRWTPSCVQHMSSQRASSHWTTEVSCAVLLNQKLSVNCRHHNIEPPSQYFNKLIFSKCDCPEKGRMTKSAQPAVGDWCFTNPGVNWINRLQYLERMLNLPKLVFMLILYSGQTGMWRYWFFAEGGKGRA